MSFSELAHNLNYVAAVILLLIGLYVVASKPNLIKKVMGLVIIQGALMLFFVSMGLVGSSGTRMVTPGFRASKLVNPIPQSIVVVVLLVSLGIFAVSLALCVRIYASEGTLDYRELKD